MLVIEDARGKKPREPRTKEEVMDRVLASIGAIGAEKGLRVAANRAALTFPDGRTFEITVHRPRIEREIEGRSFRAADSPPVVDHSWEG